MKPPYADPEVTQHAAETAAMRRYRKRHPRMKVSGARVKGLQRLIVEKGRRVRHA